MNTIAIIVTVPATVNIYMIYDRIGHTPDGIGHTPDRIGHTPDRIGYTIKT